MILKINSRSNPRLKKLLARQENVLLLEGEKLIKDILKRKIAIETLIINQNLGEREVNKFINNSNINQLWLVSESVLKKISDLKSVPDYIAVVKPPESFLNLTRVKSIMAFWDIQDPGNAGSVFRCAAAFGIKEIVFIGNCVKISNRKFLRSAQNSIFEVNYSFFPDIDSFLNVLEPLDFNIYLTSSRSGPNSVSPAEIQIPAVVIFGNEGRGIGKNQFDCYPSVRIPQSEQIDSLNVGISACIIMHELSKTHHLL